MTLTSEYKNTEIGVVPKDWNVVPLGKIGEPKMCKRIFKHQTKLTGSIPFYKISTFGNKADSFISTELFNEYRKKFSYPKLGDVLISASGTIGRTVVYKGEPAYFQDSNILWIDNDEKLISNEFLAYIYTRTNWIVSDGGIISRLYNENLKKKTFVPIPKNHEQKAIVRVLKDVDELIVCLKKLIEKKNLIKQAAIYKLLTGKIRLPSFKEKWNIKVLKDFVNIYKGKGLSKSLINFSSSKSCILYGELFTTYKNVIDKVVSRTNSNQGFMSEAGDILMPGSTTTTGIDLATASALLVNDVALGGDIIVIRSKNKNDYDPIFLAYYLSYIKKLEIAEMTQGTTIHHLYGSSLNNLSIELPADIKEQNSISNTLIDIEKEHLSLSSQLKKVLNLKNAITYKLLTGKVRLLKNKK